MDQKYGDWQLAITNEPRWLDMLASRLADKLDGHLVTTKPTVQAIKTELELDLGEEELF